MKWLVSIPTVAALVGLVGGVVTAISGGQLEIALYVIGLVGLPTIGAAGLIIWIILAAHYLPFVHVANRGDVSDAETYWAYYIGFWGIVGGLIAWASVDESGFTKAAKNFDVFHVMGIGVLVIGIVALGVLIQSAAKSRSSKTA